MAGKNKEQQYCVSKINTRVMNYRVYVMTPQEKIMYFLLLMIAGGLVGLIFYGNLFLQDGEPTNLTPISNVVVFILGGIFANLFFMKMIADSLRKKRINKLKKQFCDFASALTNALASGMNVDDALGAVYNDLCAQYSPEAFIVKETEELISGLHNNIPIEETLKDFGERSGISDIINFATVFEICYRTGGNIKSVVRRTTEIISEKIMIAGEIETVITSNKLQMSIMNILPVVIVFMMRMMSSSFAESFAGVVGVVGLTISLILTLISFKIGQKIMDIKG